MAKAVGIWTGLMVVFALVLWIVGWGEVNSMGEGGMGAAIALFLAIIGTALIWLVGVVVLVIARLFGAFRPAIPPAETDTEVHETRNDTSDG